LVLQPDQRKYVVLGLNQQVSVSVVLFGAHSAHHRTPVLLSEISFGQ